MAFDFCIKCSIHISMQLLVWFGLDNNITSFTRRCWQGNLRVLARRQYVMGWPHFAFICIMPCRTSGKEVCDVKSTRTQMFSADPEMFNPCEENKTTKTRLLATCEAWEKEKLCMDRDKMANLPLNMKPDQLLWYSGNSWNELIIKQQRSDWRKSLCTKTTPPPIHSCKIYTCILTCIVADCSFILRPLLMFWLHPLLPLTVRICFLKQVNNVIYSIYIFWLKWMFCQTPHDLTCTSLPTNYMSHKNVSF